MLAVAGCDGSSSRTSGGAAVGSVGSVGGPAVDSARDPAGAAAKAAAGAPATASPAAAQVPIQQRDIIRTVTMDVTVSNIDAAAASALSAVTAAGGRTDGDDRSGDSTGRHATLVLRVPPAKLDNLMVTVARLGHENSRTDHGQDVTASHADVNARVQELTISVGRLQDFMKHSGSINELVALESQLTQRQSELQSTVAQQRALNDEIGLATLTVQLSTSSPLSARTAGGPFGFGSAVVHALHALLLVLRWTGAILGYLLPFAIALGLLLAPFGWWLRQRRGAALPLAGPPAEPVAD
jgi:hypothetical protein